VDLKRDLVKYIRDRAKARYDKGTECFICSSTEELDFHHYNSLSPLLHRWVKANKLNPSDVLEWRDRFIEEHMVELYDEAVTICHLHHLKLHEIYGRNPNLGTAKKQGRWVQRQRDKYGLV
jgi:hypothetical protein